MDSQIPANPFAQRQLPASPPLEQTAGQQHASRFRKAHFRSSESPMELPQAPSPMGLFGTYEGRFMLSVASEDSSVSHACQSSPTGLAQPCQWRMLDSMFESATQRHTDQMPLVVRCYASNVAVAVELISSLCQPIGDIAEELLSEAQVLEPGEANLSHRRLIIALLVPQSASPAELRGTRQSLMAAGACDVVLQPENERETETALEFRVARAQRVLEDQHQSLKQRVSEFYKLQTARNKNLQKRIEHCSTFFSSVAPQVWTNIPVMQDVSFPLVEKASFNRFTLERRLCFGKRSEVFRIAAPKGKGRSKECCKFFFKSKTRSAADIDKICNEVSTLQKLNSRWVPSLLEFSQTRFFFCMRTGYAGSGSLLSYLMTPNSMAGKEEATVFGFIHGLNYMHSKSCAHREIMPENIVLNHEGNVKLVGFASSVWIKEATRMYYSTRCTDPYLPPEEQMDAGAVFSSQAMAPSKTLNYIAADVWSAAVVALETFGGLGVLGLLCAQRPHMSLEAWAEALEVQVYKLEQIPWILQKSIAGAMKVDPEKRIGLQKWASSTPSSVVTIIESQQQISASSKPSLESSSSHSRSFDPSNF